MNRDKSDTGKRAAIVHFTRFGDESAHPLWIELRQPIGYDQPTAVEDAAALLNGLILNDAGNMQVIL